MKELKVADQDKFEKIRDGGPGIMIQLEKGDDRISTPEDVMPGEEVSVVSKDRYLRLSCKITSFSYTTVGRCKEFVDSIHEDNTIGDIQSLSHSLEEATGLEVDDDDIVSVVIVEEK